MNYRGHLRELRHKVAKPIEYSLALDTGELGLQNHIGSNIRVEWLGKKACIHCGRVVKKLYQNGYCFPCVTSLAECDLCIVRPDNCHFHLGTCRDEQFGLTHCMIPHYVYLAMSSHVKVGLTRKGRQFTRWVDQGASAAILVAEFPTRKAAGEFETAVTAFLPDKTDWRKMLQFSGEPISNLKEIKRDVIARIDSKFLDNALLEENEVYHFSYPRTDDFSVSVQSLSLDKTGSFEGVLRGIKGQYLMFDDGVMNVKRWAGYEVGIEIS